MHIVYWDTYIPQPSLRKRLVNWRRDREIVWSRWCHVPHQRRDRKKSSTVTSYLTCTLHILRIRLLPSFASCPVFCSRSCLSSCFPSSLVSFLFYTVRLTQAHLGLFSLLGGGVTAFPKFSSVGSAQFLVSVRYFLASRPPPPPTLGQPGFAVVFLPVLIFPLVS